MEETRVSQIDLWRLDEPLADIDIKGGQPTDEIMRFDDFQIIMDGMVRNAEGPTQLRGIEQPAVIMGYHAHQPSYLY